MMKYLYKFKAVCPHIQCGLHFLAEGREQGDDL